jgi:cysteine desulfurase / selenocysteine lyase
VSAQLPVQRLDPRNDGRLIYFDHAATSWPKPPGVAEQMVRLMAAAGGNPGRAGHRLAIEAARVVYRTREAVARLFNAADPLRVVFTANVTEALNLALLGWLRPGDHVVTSSVEHNSVMRPLRALERQGVDLTVVGCSPEGFLDPEHVKKALRRNTALIALTHASNVCGTLLPIREIGRIAREQGMLLLVDAAQTAGAYPIDLQADPIDLLAFTGHKSMYGPMGTGGLVLGERVDPNRLQPLKRGGTGSRSQFEEQPDFLPDRYESGTVNAVGLAGLAAGINWVLRQRVEAIRAHERALTAQVLTGLGEIRGVKVHGPCCAAQQTATVSLSVAGLEVSDIGQRLDEEYGILCRVGLHCAPTAHRTLGTFPAGTVRFGLGATNTAAEVEAALEAVRHLAGEAS